MYVVCMIYRANYVNYKIIKFNITTLLQYFDKLLAKSKILGRKG